MPANLAPPDHGARSWRFVATLSVLVVAVMIGSAALTRADHESTNLLTFAPVAGSSAPDAAGSGEIEYHGGLEPESRWTSMFAFSGLEPDSPYVVMVMGRTGQDGSAAAAAFSPICTVQTDETGTGQCWDYELSMKRIGVVQLRQRDESGPIVLQATRQDGGPGEIVSVPNAFSPSPTDPVASPPPLLGSPLPG